MGPFVREGLITSTDGEIFLPEKITSPEGSLSFVRASLVIAILTSVLVAQENASGDFDFSQAEPDRTSQSAQGGDGTYVVKKWDTLWDLAFSFLENPFMWREIWELNPQVENPHLIYPGDRIRIPNLGEPSGISQPSTRAYLERPDFSQITQGIAITEDITEEENEEQTDAPVVEPGMSDATTTSLYRSLVSKNYFTRDYLSKCGRLWMKEDDEGNVYPGNGRLDRCGKENVYRRYDELLAETYRPSVYSVGDIIQVIRSDRFVRYNGEVANLVRTIGRAKMVAVEENRVRAQLLEVWDVIRCDDRIARDVAIPERTIGAVQRISDQLQGKVFMRVETTESPYVYQNFIIDKGAADNVKLGDIFAVYPVSKKEVVDPNPSIISTVVNVQETSSTLAIIKMHSDNLKPGDIAKLTHRVVFDQLHAVGDL